MLVPTRIRITRLALNPADAMGAKGPMVLSSIRQELDFVSKFGWSIYIRSSVFVGAAGQWLIALMVSSGITVPVATLARCTVSCITPILASPGRPAWTFQ